MEANKILNLFDDLWFKHEILTNPRTSSPLLATPDPQIPIETLKQEISSVSSSRHVRSLSDQLISQTSSSGSDSLSPKSVLNAHKLETILSGKEGVHDQVIEPKPVEVEIEVLSLKKAVAVAKKGRQRNKRSSKSLSDLEFEELKGFIDLGFVFSEEDKNSSLVSIIPGLQRFGEKKEKKEEEEDVIVEKNPLVVVERPYLSEAWKNLDRRKYEKMPMPLLNWRVSDFGNEINMKDHLKCWAHTVALSSVR